MDAIPALYINSAGLTQAVDPSRAAEVESLGWVPASAEQARDYFTAQQYGSAGQAAIAGLESFGSMLTLGTSTWAETAAGVPAEDIRAREKYNPGASGVGTAAGILVPLIMSGGSSASAQGTSAASKVASATAPALLAKAGAATSKALLPKLAANAPLAQRLAARGLAAAAGGAVEGAGYEVGQLVHEAALGDPNLTAESALARIGTSAATFGALTGGLSVLGTLAGEGVSKAKGTTLGATLEGWLKGFEGDRGLKAAGAIQSDVTRASKQISRDELNALGREMGGLGLVTPFSTPAQTLQRADDLMARAGATMGDVLKSADEIARAEGTTMGGGYTALARARKEILKPLQADPLQREAAGRFLGDLDAFEPMFANGATLEQLHGVRRSVDQALYGMRGTMDPYATAYKQALHDFRGLVSESIEAGVTKSGIPLEVWKEANRQYQVGARAAEFAEKGMDRLLGNNPLGLSAVVGGVAGTVAGGPVGGLATSIGAEVVRRHASGTANYLARELRGLLAGTSGAAVADGTAQIIAMGRRTAFGAANGVPEDSGAPDPEIVVQRASGELEAAAALAALARAKSEVTEEVDGALTGLLKAAPKAERPSRPPDVDPAEVRRLAAAPEMLQEALTRQADDLQGHAPAVAQALQMATARAVAFLASKAPAAALPGAFAAKAKPSVAESAKFQRYADVAFRPLRALEHAKRGTLTPEHVASLQVVWPALYTHIQGRFIEALMGHRGQLSPQSRMMLAMLTGYDIDGSLTSNAIAANQAVYAGMSAGPERAPNPNAGALKQAGRVETRSQRADRNAQGGA